MPHDPPSFLAVGCPRGAKVTRHAFPLFTLTGHGRNEQALFRSRVDLTLAHSSLAISAVAREMCLYSLPRRGNHVNLTARLVAVEDAGECGRLRFRALREADPFLVDLVAPRWRAKGVVDPATAYGLSVLPPS
jgi:hypothetical protein